MPATGNPLRDRRPLTILLRDRILSIITKQGLVAGDRVPTEAELAADFGVGRTTVRESLKLLEQDGYVVCRHGVGLFVSSPPSLVRPLNRLEGVTDMLSAHGLTARGTVVSHETICPDESITEILGRPDEEVVRRLVHLASAGVEIVSATCDLSAVLLDAQTAEILGTDPGDPWLLMVQQHLTSDGRPVLYSRD